MIGPDINLFDQDMIESVLSCECARRRIAATGPAAREIDGALHHAFALGMRDGRDLAVFIRNLIS